MLVPMRLLGHNDEPTNHSADAYRCGCACGQRPSGDHDTPGKIIHRSVSLVRSSAASGRSHYPDRRSGWFLSSVRVLCRIVADVERNAINRSRVTRCLTQLWTESTFKAAESATTASSVR